MVIFYGNIMLQSSSIIFIILFGVTLRESSAGDPTSNQWHLDFMFQMLNYKCNIYNLTTLSEFERDYCNKRKPRTFIPLTTIPPITIINNNYSRFTDTFLRILFCWIILGIVVLSLRYCGGKKPQDNEEIQDERTRLNANSNLINHTPTYQPARMVIPTETSLPETSNALETSTVIYIPSAPIMSLLNFEGPTPVPTLPTSQLVSPPRYFDPEEPPPEYPAPPSYKECIEKG
ncbi:unnamed protein product [Orchesella dallaii]|uniref:Uncharacterized protein n=1 Tax=Orchesella dallaii TaxID=48710 RepID=A0ABP1S7Y8_9HEXA